MDVQFLQSAAGEDFQRRDAGGLQTQLPEHGQSFQHLNVSYRIFLQVQYLKGSASEERSDVRYLISRKTQVLQRQTLQGTYIPYLLVVQYQYLEIGAALQQTQVPVAYITVHDLADIAVVGGLHHGLMLL